MAELNDKLITYGNLSTFYDKLQEQGLGGNAIEEVSELPNASENKDKLFRLDNGDKDVYAAKLISSTVLPPTNKLPDEQQIDKAYLYNITNSLVLYYKGIWKIICPDGEISLSCWGDDWDNYTTHFSYDNAENINSQSETLNYGDLISEEVDENTKTIIVNDTISELKSYFWVDNNLVPIPATYNAPESAQIGNATLYDAGEFLKWIYDGTEVTITIEGKQFIGYKWISDGDAPNDIFLTNKQALNIYFYDNNGVPLSDVKCYRVSGGVAIEDGLDSLYIPQLNAPDSEQVDNAYLVEDYIGGTCIYTGEEVTFQYNNIQLTGYTWARNDDSCPVYSTKRANEIYNTDGDNDSVHFYIDEYGTIDEITFDGGTLLTISTVKYQRTEVREVWDWEKVATEQYVDNAIDNIEFPEYVAGEGIAIDSANTISCTVKPIADVSALPDADENKNKVLRLNTNNKVYVSYGAFNTQQIDKAYLDEVDGNEHTYYYYKGEYIVNCSDGILKLPYWYSEDVQYSYYTKLYPAGINTNQINSFSEDSIFDSLHIELDEETEIPYTELTVSQAESIFNSLTGGTTMGVVVVSNVVSGWKKVVTEDAINILNETTFTGATLTVDGSQPSIVASGTTTIVWDDLASSIPSGKTVEVSVVLINTGNSALTPTMQGNTQMMGDGNLTIQAGELGLYRGRYIAALDKWLVEAIYQEVSGIME